VVRPFERRPAGQALVQQRAQGVDVCRRSRIAHLARRLLRRHVRRRPHDRARLAHVTGIGVDPLGQAEVGDLVGQAFQPDGLARVRLESLTYREQHVARLQVAMHHATQVGVVHRPRQSLDQRSRLPRGRSLFLQLLGKRAAVAELQREEGLPPDLAGLVQLHDLRVLQAGHRLGLNLEAQSLGWAGVFDGPDHL